MEGNKHYKKVSGTISWERFYDKYMDWDEKYAIDRSKDLTNFGSGDEIMEVAYYLFFDDEAAANTFIRNALTKGVIFHADNLVDISYICDEDTTKTAVIASGSVLTEDDLSVLYGNVDDDVIAEVAKRHGLSLPKDLLEDEDEEDDMAEEESDDDEENDMDEEDDIDEEENDEDDDMGEEDLRWAMNSAAHSADYALQCLYQALAALNAGENFSVVDMLTKGFMPSVLKHAALADAEQELRIACDALEDLNAELSNILVCRDVKFRYTKLASAIDLWFDSGFIDCLTHLQINKVQKRIKKAISQVERIKWELRRA